MLRAAVLLVAAGCAAAPERAAAPPDFARLISDLSEPGGFFDTDNLISNESSYLHAISELETAGIRGGAYLGVGPGQNFSYIAAIEPELALIVDIRSDNVLQHLMYKALFHESRNRLEYLALLTGRPVPRDVEEWTGVPLERVLEYVDSTAADDLSARQARARVRTAVGAFGVELTEQDLDTLERFHTEFIVGGLGLRFRSFGRAPQYYYPTLRGLIEERDREGDQVGYLSTEGRFQTVRRMQLENRIIPVVGNLAGDQAMPAVAEFLERRGLVVSAFYTSNVEFYLFGDRIFDRFIANLAALPLDENSVIIRSIFSRGGPHPRREEGHYSVQAVQPARTLVERWNAGRYSSYRDVVTRDLMPADRRATP